MKTIRTPSLLTQTVLEFGRSYSQSFFVQNAAFGLGIPLILAVFDPGQALWGVTASIVSRIFQGKEWTPRAIREYGLIPLNGFFLGIAAATLLQRSEVNGIITLVLAALIPLITTAMYQFLLRWKLSVLISPALLCTYALVLLPGLERPLVFQNSAGVEIPQLVFASVGRWMHQSTPLAGILFFSWLSIFRPKNAIALVLGTGLSVIVGYSLLTVGVARSELHLSELALSGGIVALGLSTFPERPRWIRIALASVFATILSVLLAGAFAAAGLPILSAPYVITLWAVQLSLQSRVRLVTATPSVAFRRPIGVTAK